MPPSKINFLLKNPEPLLNNFFDFSTEFTAFLYYYLFNISFFYFVCDDFVTTLGADPVTFAVSNLTLCW